jgi:hypothetical protein
MEIINRNWKISRIFTKLILSKKKALNKKKSLEKWCEKLLKNNFMKNNKDRNLCNKLILMNIKMRKSKFLKKLSNKLKNKLNFKIN